MGHSAAQSLVSGDFSGIDDVIACGHVNRDDRQHGIHLHLMGRSAGIALGVCADCRQGVMGFAELCDVAGRNADRPVAAADDGGGVLHAVKGQSDLRTLSAVAGPGHLQRLAFGFGVNHILKGDGINRQLRQFGRQHHGRVLTAGVTRFISDADVHIIAAVGQRAEHGCR